MDLSDILPVPNLLEARNVLCFQPHPDDLDIAAGGTLFRLTDAGARVTLVTMTDGSKGTSDPNQEPRTLAESRRAEQTAATQATGVQNLVWLPYVDGELPETDAVRDQIISLIRRIRPDLVLTIDPDIPYEAHPDHLRTGRMVLAAALFAPLPRFAFGSEPHEVPAVALAQTHRPNTYVDVTAVFDRKLSAVAAHRSQFPPEQLQRFSAYLHVRCADYGKKIGAQYAEAFKVLTPTHLHYNPDAEEC
ncbi:MAG: PIG-L deacetylase family protein [Bacillota bacterium]